MMAEVWILVFIFHGALYATGPWKLEDCRLMSAAQPVAASAICVHKDRPRVRITATPKGQQ